MLINKLVHSARTGGGVVEFEYTQFGKAVLMNDVGKACVRHEAYSECGEVGEGYGGGRV